MWEIWFSLRRSRTWMTIKVRTYYSTYFVNIQRCGNKITHTNVMKLSKGSWLFDFCFRFKSSVKNIKLIYFSTRLVFFRAAVAFIRRFLGVGIFMDFQKFTSGQCDAGAFLNVFLLPFHSGKWHHNLSWQLRWEGTRFHCDGRICDSAYYFTYFNNWASLIIGFKMFMASRAVTLASWETKMLRT
jgi:hypothetical protein